MDAVKTIQKGHLTGYVYESAEAMGQAAADYMEKEIIELLKQKEEVTLLLSAGISQHTFHTALAKKKSFDWGRVNLMEIDEEIGLPEGHKVLCATGIKKYFHEAGVNYKEFFAFKSDAEDTDAECRRFEQVLKEHEPDLAFIGIGINGHVALNEPGQGTFDDDRACRVVAISERTKQQDIDAGNYKTADECPKYGYTITLPALMRMKRRFTIIPYPEKANSVYEVFFGEIREAVPCTCARMQEWTLFMDTDSSFLIRDLV